MWEVYLRWENVQSDEVQSVEKCTVWEEKCAVCEEQRSRDAAIQLQRRCTDDASLSLDATQMLMLMIIVMMMLTQSAAILNLVLMLVMMLSLMRDAAIQGGDTFITPHCL